MNPLSNKDFTPVEELKNLQLEKLRRIIDYEYGRVPLFRRRCDERGVKPSDVGTLEDLAKFPFMVKTDLRDEYPMGLTAAPLGEIVRFHCSSGTTGKPICIPNTRGDIEVWADATARALAMFGVTSGDVLQVSYGYGLFTGGLGLHYGGELMGCAVLPTSAGNTEKQLMLMRDLGTTAIACTPSYFLYVIDVAKKLGIDFRRDTRLRHGIFGAEPWTDEMRAKIEDSTGITAHDIYGLTEISGPGVAASCPYCERSCPGLHIFEDHYYPEIIDPKTLEPLPDGEEGELVFTTLDRFGTPMIRYRTRDLTRLHTGRCECGRTMRVMDRIRNRSDDMLIVHGVNLFPSQVETALLSVPEVEPHYQIILTPTENLDLLEIKVEIRGEAFSDNIRALEELRKKVFYAVKQIIGLSPKITLVEPGSLPRSEGKIRRVIDNRR
ncbi:MAG: phenylacetate--CoA ligase [Kiritimatiellae bacterium]|nr:phenylacetate--CoA ligase [Kiritimatiellia bacterium]